jgi:hypothetical protein
MFTETEAAAEVEIGGWLEKSARSGAALFFEK